MLIYTFKILAMKTVHEKIFSSDTSIGFLKIYL